MNIDLNTIKDELEQREYEILSPYATKCKESKGRKRERIEDYPIRTAFQRDRDKILHSKSFRRLKHKTQVFLSPFNDHFRTRLTHTLEVSQIARTMARALKLNEDLVEAISLGHDLGHTPFGHCGEGVLAELLPNGFSHNIQSVRVVEVLEDMNLCYETVDGILTHSWGYKPNTPEAQVVQYADKIAYINHDIEDSVRAGVIAESDLPKDCLEYFSMNQSARLGKMITDVITNSMDKPTVAMSEEGWSYVTKLRGWMFEHVYLDPVTKAEEKKARNIVKSLYEYYTDKLSAYCDKEDIPQLVTDYISGMSDQYAIRRYMDIFIPKPLAEQSNDDALFRRIQDEIR
ncbi:MAG: deoxyguanosinetriphosphate triphosphohydrolase [Cyanobacteria bacterium SIG31]|nr:deoxyguanosinetriphosphate triphosphohydrolase [Cyanobacteria bacterium SIG31]